MKKILFVLLLAFVANAAFAQEETTSSPWTFNAELRAFGQYGEGRFIGGLDNWPRVWIGFNLNEHLGAQTQLRLGGTLLHEAFFRINPFGLLGIDAANLTFRVGMIETSATSYTGVFRTEYNERDYFSRAQDHSTRRTSIEALLSFAAFPELSVRWISDLDMSTGRNSSEDDPLGQGPHNPAWGRNTGWIGLGEINLNNLDLGVVNIWANAYANLRINIDNNFGVDPLEDFIASPVLSVTDLALANADAQFFGGTLRVGINNLPVLLDVGGSFEFVRAIPFQLKPGSIDEWEAIDDHILTGFSFTAGARVGIPDTFNLAVNYSQIVSDENTVNWLAERWTRSGAASVAGLNFEWLGFGFMRPFLGVGAILTLTESGEEARPDWFDTE